MTVRAHAKALLMFNTVSCNDESHRFKGYEALLEILPNNVMFYSSSRSNLLK